MVNLKTASDDSLWKAVSAGDLDAEEILTNRYSVLVRKCARPYFLVGGDSEDLIQEGMLGLLSAVRSYSPDLKVPFRTYAERCIKRRVYSAIRSASRLKHRPLNDSISIESPDLEKTMALSNDISRVPEELVITRELTDELKHQLRNNLSSFEKKVLDFYLDGLSYADIAVKVAKPVKSVDNAVQRIRKKLFQQF